MTPRGRAEGLFSQGESKRSVRQGRGMRLDLLREAKAKLCGLTVWGGIRANYELETDWNSRGREFKGET